MSGTTVSSNRPHGHVVDGGRTVRKLHVPPADTAVPSADWAVTATVYVTNPAHGADGVKVAVRVGASYDTTPEALVPASSVTAKSIEDATALLENVARTGAFRGTLTSPATGARAVTTSGEESVNVNTGST